MIEIKYNGSYPNLCSGDLFVTVNGMTWEFPKYCLSSGGSVTFDKNWSEEVTDGEWTVKEWPVGFPKKYKDMVEDEINRRIPHGCCGGCV